MADYNATLLPVPRVDDDVREQDRYLPVANIARIMKRVLPPNEKIAKDAKEAVQECVSEFICFLTSEASDRCQTEKRKTINGDDLVWVRFSHQQRIRKLNITVNTLEAGHGDPRIR